MEAVGRYRVERRLGSGAFATVWLGYDDDLDVPVAIKVLAENWTHHADVRRRFADEARVLRRIGDPRVVAVHDIGSLPDGRPYFVMDFADAGTLAERLRNGPLPPDLALGYAVEAARAVQVLHDHGVLHRDVKPSNLLLRHRADGREQLTITDLGTAKALAEASGLTLSAGSPAYMAPEQAHGQSGLDVRCDVYGVAAVAYALLTGSPPFGAESGVLEVATRDPQTRPAPVGSAGGQLDALLQAALAYDPADRPPSAAALADRLAEVLADRSATTISAPRVAAPPPPTPTKLDPPALPPARPRPATGRFVGLAAAAFVGVVVLTAVITWLVLGLAS